MFRLFVAGSAIALCAAAGLQAVGVVAAGAATTCTVTTNAAARTITLDGNCTTNGPTPAVVVPDGFTLDGAGHTVTVTDPPGGFYSGAVVTNAGPVMNVQNLIIQGPTGGFAVPNPGDCGALIFGILYGPGASGAAGVAASGAVNNVQIHDLYQQGTSAFGSCQVGHAIRANAFTGPAQTVTITNTTVTGYQKGGLTASGAFMTMNVSNSTIGPPAPLGGR
jgi:hypothetical protein